MVSIDTFSKEDIQMANRHRKWCFTSVIIKEMQIHTNRSYPLTSTEIAIIKKNTNKCWQGCGDKEMLEHCCSNVNWCSQYGKDDEGSSKRRLPHDSAISFLDISWEKPVSWKDNALLVTMLKMWKQVKCPLTIG